MSQRLLLGFAAALLLAGATPVMAQSSSDDLRPGGAAGAPSQSLLATVMNDLGLGSSNEPAPTTRTASADQH